ncbi:hypothetical protein ACJMK2_031659 [Sinanodonta woodiana]|uniref:Uncharacterized protein n=1 Tax=Sinanodonta woodiana TaxID=1069815 RepID=A0ABD3X0W0_SINWO
MIDSTLFITVKKDNNTILNMSMGVDIDRISTYKNGRIMLKYNQTIKELYLLIENISKKDGGIYEMKESFYATNTISGDAKDDIFDRKDDKWLLEIYVLESGDIKHGYAGGNISMQFARSTQHSYLYNYEKLSAHLAG